MFLRPLVAEPLIAALLAVIVYLPPLAIDPRGLSRTDWLTHVESLRATILQALGGLALLGTLYFSARTLRLNRRGQLTERFSKAIEQLGSDRLAVRLGGIYALEQIAFDSAELHWPIMEVLTAYLREHRPARAAAEAGADSAGPRLPADHQAIATVIGRRRVEQDPAGQRLVLSDTDLTGVNWATARLEGAFLNGARLERAYLVGAHLERADLLGAYLEGANLGGAHLEGAELHWAHGLTGDQLQSAYLARGSLGGAHLVDGVIRWAPGLTRDQLKRLDQANRDLNEQSSGQPPEPSADKPS